MAPIKLATKIIRGIILKNKPINSKIKTCNAIMVKVLNHKKIDK